MTCYNTLDSGEPDARAVELGRVRQARERLEQQVLLPHVETDAVVADIQRAALGAQNSADLDTRRRSASSVLPCVADQIRESSPEQRGINEQT